jgi:hypothetical protein
MHPSFPQAWSTLAVDLPFPSYPCTFPPRASFFLGEKLNSFSYFTCPEYPILSSLPFIFSCDGPRPGLVVRTWSTSAAELNWEVCEFVDRSGKVSKHRSGGSGGRALAIHNLSPGFNPQYHKRRHHPASASVLGDTSNPLRAGVDFQCSSHGFQVLIVIPLPEAETVCFLNQILLLFNCWELLH